MIKQTLIAVFLIFIFNNDLTAQRNHSIYLELGGASPFYSLNYDVRILNKKDGFGLRAGLSIFPEFLGSGTDRSIPIQINYLLGKTRHQFEIGLGATYVNTKGKEGESTEYTFNTATLAYRCQGKHFMFKAGINSLIYNNRPDGNLNIHPFWPGISFGYTF